MQTTEATLTRKQIRSVLANNRGSAAALAKEIGVTHGALSLWLKGKSTSKNIAQAAQTKASQILEQERGGSNAQ